MRPRLLIVVAALLAATSSVLAQDGAKPIQRWPTRETPRTSTPGSPPASTPQPRERTAEPRRPAEPATATPPPATSTPVAGDDQRRPQGGGSPDGERVAVPRTRPVPDDRRTESRPVPRGGSAIYLVPRSPRYAYSPRNAYPYGYGAFGLGYFYYDPYTWYSTAPLYSYGPGAFGRGFGYDVGELRLRVTPRETQVYVDGYFAGSVDDYDGSLQGLKLESGPYHIELVLQGYETLSFDVRITPGQKITYRGDLRRLP